MVGSAKISVKFHLERMYIKKLANYAKNVKKKKKLTY